MKVVIYVPYFYKGGIEQLVSSLAKESKAEDEIIMDLIIESHSPSNFIEQVSPFFNRVFIIPSIELNPIKYFVKLLDIFKKEKYDVIISHNFYRSPLIFYISKITGIKYRVFQAHSVDQSYKNNKLKHILYNLNFKLATNLLAVSQESAVALFDKKDFHIIPNGIDISKFKFDFTANKSLRDLFGLCDSDVILGYVSRFEADKNHLFLIELVQNLPPKFKLFFVGYGDYIVDVYSYIERYNVKKQVFVIEDPDNISDYYSLFDIFLFPSIKEGFGNVTLEALCSGLNVIKNSNIPSPPKISNQRIFNLNLEPIKWRELILELSSNIDELRSLEFREFGVELIKQGGYDSFSTFSKYKDYLNKVIEERQVKYE